MKAIVAGPRDDIAAAIEEAGGTVVRLEAPVTREKLLDAGVETADVFVLTDVTEATAVPVALDDNPALRVVIYAEESMPEFVRAQVDLALDPALFPPAAVAEELVASTG